MKRLLSQFVRALAFSSPYATPTLLYYDPLPRTDRVRERRSHVPATTQA